jgi:hypothetical protein
MMWALRRRAITFLIIAAVLVSPFFYFYGKYKANQVFTCTDNKQNGDETGIDCGGSCTRMCTEDVKALVTDWVVPVKVTDDVYHMAALVENRNLFALPKINYKMSMYDKDNFLISERTGYTYVPANSSFVISELLVPVGKRVPKLAFIKFEEASFWQQVDMRQAASFLKTSQPQWFTTDIGSRLTATIKNTERVAMQDIDVTAVVFDKDDNVIALSTTNIDHLDQSEVAPLVFTWPAVITPEKTRLYARENPFLNKTIALPLNPQYHLK